ncbi:MAG TPA: glycoside hydrolase family 38 C-terminal domain-containing protein [Streptosporangiaceae bacterium]|nr:glycoside hydrolase family 38 C-terminal domain-containing protein [Streptosporangiaceae bacterium]
MRISEVAGTDLFCGTDAMPLQVIRVSVINDGADMVRDRSAVISVSVHGPGVVTPRPAAMTGLERGEQRTVEVGVRIAAPGSVRQVTAVAQSLLGRWEAPGQVTVAETGWTMWMVSHFHYDPVWWNTQGRFTQTWPLLPPEDGAPAEVATVFDLVRLHLAEARADPDYKFVLAEIDYLKPFFDAYPQERADLLALIKAGRIEIVGGSYNEPNTNLTCAESTIRNAVYGLAFQREVLGAAPSAAWMLDAFGFDPAYPGLMAAAGMTESSWARGPYHQWGPGRTDGGNVKMQFAAEFEWLSPDGTGLLTSYMANHYSAGWVTQQAGDLATAERDAYRQFRELAPVAATRNVLLPVGGDHVVPSRWATAIHRDWNSRYVWPRFVTAVPSEFFAAVREQAADAGTWILPQTRDMNPVYTGKDVTYIDTKQAQRDAEVALLDGERLATLAWLAGAGYPAASLDKAWRLLVFGAHHDAITGTEGDQVYLDLLAGWREAFERGDEARARAARFLAGQVDTASVGAARPADATRAVVVFNTLSRPRSGMARIALAFPEGAAAHVRVTDEDGARLPALAEGVTRHGDGSLAAVTLTFRCADVPPVGYRTYLAACVPPGASGGQARPEPDGADQEQAEGHGWNDAGGLVIENETFLVSADDARGGVLSSIVDRRSGAELLAGPGNELVLMQEYPTHPKWGEGPWLLCPTGAARGSAGLTAKVWSQRSPVGSRLVAEFALEDLRVVQETLLWDGAQTIEFRTHVDGSIGQDRLLRARFATDVPGGLPVYQTALSVIGRTPGPLDTDVAEHTYTLDCPAHEWFAVGSTATVAVSGRAGQRRVHAIGVAEVIAPAGPASDRFAPRDAGAGAGVRPAVRDLMIALARQGVTATCSVPGGTRYGSLQVDSNLPDVRIALGGPDENAFTAQVLTRAGRTAAAELRTQLAATGSARLWIPAARGRAEAFAAGADVRGVADLPVLVVAGHDLGTAIAALADDLADAQVHAWWAGPGAGPGAGAVAAAEPGLAPRSVALLNRGLPGSLVTPAGEACISLMRACSAWPAGVWIDGDKRAVPDGSSFAWQHWSHTFEYALAAGEGDWRAAGFPAAGQEYSHPLLAFETGSHPGPLPAAASLAAVTPAGADLMTLKPRGNPLVPLGQPDPRDGVTVRLRDLGGAGTTATVRLFTGIATAVRTGLLEQGDEEPVGCADGAATVAVPERGTVTLAVRPAEPAWPAIRAAAASAPPEPVQPVFTRYWLHGKGPAPAGNLPVAVHISPDLVILRPGGMATVSLTVGCGHEPVSGTVQLDIPAGLRLTAVRSADGASGGQLSYDLAASGYAAWDLDIEAAPAGAAGARRYLTARITDGAGLVLEDAAVVAIGQAEPPPADLPLAELLARLEEVTLAEAAEAVLTGVTGDLELPPGGHGEITVRLSSSTASGLHGEAQLISPHGSWTALADWTAGFSVEPGGSVPLTFPVAIPADARPGQQWWALVKVMYFGRLRYSEPVWIKVVS